MLSVDKKKISLIHPYITITLDKTHDLSVIKNFLIVVFFQHYKYCLIPFPYSHKVRLDFFKEVDLLRRLKFIVISVIDYSGREHFKCQVDIDASKYVFDYSKCISASMRFKR